MMNFIVYFMAHNNKNAKSLNLGAQSRKYHLKSDF